MQKSQHGLSQTASVDVNAVFSAQHMIEPTVSQPLFHVPHPMCATEGGSEEKEETQAEGGEVKA